MTRHGPSENTEQAPSLWSLRRKPSAIEFRDSDPNPHLSQSEEIALDEVTHLPSTGTAGDQTKSPTGTLHGLPRRALAFTTRETLPSNAAYPHTENERHLTKTSSVPVVGLVGARSFEGTPCCLQQIENSASPRTMARDLLPPSIPDMDYSLSEIIRHQTNKMTWAVRSRASESLEVPPRRVEQIEEPGSPQITARETLPSHMKHPQAENDHSQRPGSRASESFEVAPLSVEQMEDMVSFQRKTRGALPSNMAHPRSEDERHQTKNLAAPEALRGSVSGEDTPHRVERNGNTVSTQLLKVKVIGTNMRAKNHNDTSPSPVLQQSGDDSPARTMKSASARFVQTRSLLPRTQAEGSKMCDGVLASPSRQSLSVQPDTLVRPATPSGTNFQRRTPIRSKTSLVPESLVIHDVNLLRSSCLLSQKMQNVRHQNKLKLAVFDFDCTLSSYHVFSSLAGVASTRRKLPVAPPHASTEIGQLARLRALDADWKWGPGIFALKAFGGESRISRLRGVLSELRNSSVECVIVSRGLIGPITKCLYQVNLLEFFTRIIGNVGSAFGSTDYDCNLSQSTHGMEEHLLGHPHNDFGGARVSKAEHIKRFMATKGLSFNEVVFTEDELAEVREVQSNCKTIHVSSDIGMQEKEFRVFEEILQDMRNAVSCSRRQSFDARCT